MYSRSLQRETLAALILAAPFATVETAAGQGCVLHPSGLIAWWDGDAVSATTAFDIQGGNDGTLLNGATFATGKVGQAFEFDGVDDFIEAPFSQTGPFTVDLWVKAAMTQQPEFNSVFSSGRRVPPNGFFQIDIDGSLVRNYRFLAGGGEDVTNPLFSLGIGAVTLSFQHIAVTYDGSTVTTYLNGEMQNSGVWPGATQLGFEKAKIAVNRSGNRRFDGLIDEVEIYNRALSDSEILAIFNAGSAGKCKIEPEIDIKPGSFPNSINLGSQGFVPVAILSSPDFDANDVDADTVELAGAGVAVRGRGSNLMAHLEDVNGDGLLDLVIQVETQNFDPGQFQDGFATLTGLTFGGSSIGGVDEIVIVPQ